MTISIWNRSSKGGSGQERPRRYGIVALVLIGLLAGMLSSLGGSLGASSAEAATGYSTFKRAYGVVLPAGTGRPYGGWVGTFTGKSPQGDTLIGPCIDRNERIATATKIVTSTSKLPLANSEESMQMRYLANKYGATKSNTTAKRLALATWVIQDPKVMRTYMKEMVQRKKLTSSDVKAVENMIKEAKKHGPYTLKLTGKAVGETKSTTVTATVKTKKGASAPAGGVVKFTSSKNAKIVSINGKKGAKSGTTTSKGVAKAVVKVVGPGKVTVTAQVTYPSSKAVLMNVTALKNSQRIIGGKLKESAKGGLSFEKKVGAPTYTTVCDEDCDGTAATTVKVCNDAANSPIKYAIMRDGKLLAYLSADAGKCASKTYELKDGNVLTSKYCHTSKVGGDCTTSWKKVSGSYVIECPAWATAEITVGCNCSKSWASVKFIAPADSPRFYSGRVVLTKDGVEVGNIPVKAIAAGKSVTVQIPMQVSAGLVIEARFSAFKDAEMKQPMVSDEVLTQVMVMKVAGKSVTYDKTTSVGGELVESSTKTVKVDLSKNN